MTAVIQRVLSVSVETGGKIIAECRSGLLILLGIENGDNDEIAEAFARKISKLRIFCDDADKMNLSVMDVNGSVIIVSNFTLCADCSHGNRPSFPAASPSVSEPIYQNFVKYFGNLIGNDKVGCGQFGADMKISLVNDGPVTMVLESDKVLPAKLRCRNSL